MSATRKHSTEILITSLFFVVLFLGMLSYLAFFTATSEQEMINNSYNSRQEILLSRNYRGSIVADDGTVLAETVLDVEENETRSYPFGNLFSHIIGYDSHGKMGIEGEMNYYLINSNTSVSRKAANDLAGKKNPGDTVYSTLNVTLQQVAEDEIGFYKGCAIVTEVKTGRILSMVSKPDFDPNEIGSIWDDLLNHDDSTVLLNRATQGLYPPGSTFKIFTTLEYLRENALQYQDYQYSCGGFYQSGEDRIRCYHSISHGSVDLSRSFAKSCNSSFANIGMGLDRTLFADTLDALYFNRALPVTMTHSKSRVELSEDTIDNAMMQVSIGQGTTVMTPLHLNMLTASIANGGTLMKPYCVDRVANSEGTVIKSFSPQSLGRIMTEEETEILKELMHEVTQTGTAKELNSSLYTAAGKTGSAEYNDSGDSHAWFTGFAPVEDPEVCVTILIESSGSGGDYAVPIARRILNAYFTGHAYGVD